MGRGKQLKLKGSCFPADGLGRVRQCEQVGVRLPTLLSVDPESQTIDFIVPVRFGAGVRPEHHMDARRAARGDLGRHDGSLYRDEFTFISQNSPQRVGLFYGSLK